MPQLKERVNFTIDRSVRTKLEEHVPKSKRSAFVESAIEKALKDNAGKELLDWLDTMPKFTPKDGMGSVETLRKVRQNMSQSVLDGLSSKPQS